MPLGITFNECDETRTDAYVTNTVLDIFWQVGEERATVFYLAQFTLNYCNESIWPCSIIILPFFKNNFLNFYLHLSVCTISATFFKCGNLNLKSELHVICFYIAQVCICL